MALGVLNNIAESEKSNTSTYHVRINYLHNTQVNKADLLGRIWTRKRISLLFAQFLVRVSAQTRSNPQNNHSRNAGLVFDCPWHARNKTLLLQVKRIVLLYLVFTVFAPAKRMSQCLELAYVGGGGGYGYRQFMHLFALVCALISLVHRRALIFRCLHCSKVCALTWNKAYMYMDCSQNKSLPCSVKLFP